MKPSDDGAPAEEALKQSEERFRGLLEAAPDAMVVVDRDGTILQVNSQAEVLFGYERAELLGKPIELLVPARFREVHVRHRNNFVAHPHTRPMGIGLDLCALRKDGRELPVEISLSPLETPQGLLVISATRDVTRRRLLDQSLKESEERYRRLVELSPEAIMVDQNGAIVFSNPAGARLLAVAGPGDLIGKRLDDFIHPEDRPYFLEMVQHVRTTGTETPLLERRLRRPDGSTVFIEVIASAIAYKGEPALLVIIRDITARRKAMEALTTRTAELQKARELNELKDHFLSTLSHEMKTPLTLITGYAELMEDKYPAEDLLEGIKEGARRLADHINSMLDYSALLSGSLPLYRTKTEVSEVIKTVQAIEEGAFQLKRIRLVIEMEPDLPPILADSRRLAQALVELLENARKFTGEGGEVALRARRWDGQIQISVTDTGPGIPEAERHRIWDAFVQVETGDAFRKGGLGLGLAIVKQLVQLHGGRVGLESELGVGSRFTLMLPIDSNPNHHLALGGVP